MPVVKNYEVSSEGAVRHWTVSTARLSNATPTPTEPAMVTALVAGTEITGTVLSINPAGSAAPTDAVLDVTHSMVYRQTVRNVRTYGGGPAEASWGVINEGDPIYYDPTATMPANVHLSTSPLNGAGNANPLFGHAVGADDADRALFPKGAAGATTVTGVCVMQEGA